MHRDVMLLFKVTQVEPGPQIIFFGVKLEQVFLHARCLSCLVIPQQCQSSENFIWTSYI